jgi:hypothetical protein
MSVKYEVPRAYLCASEAARCLLLITHIDISQKEKVATCSCRSAAKGSGEYVVRHK